MICWLFGFRGSNIATENEVPSASGLIGFRILPSEIGEVGGFRKFEAEGIHGLECRGLADEFDIGGADFGGLEAQTAAGRDT